MGFVLLDMTFRVERAFKVRIPKGWHELMGMSWQDGGSDATLDQYHEFVLGLCREQGVNPPSDSLATSTEPPIGIQMPARSSATHFLLNAEPSRAGHLRRPGAPSRQHLCGLVYSSRGFWRQFC